MRGTRPAVDTARCRSCGAGGLFIFLSLGKLPLPDALLRTDQLSEPEPRYPLDVAFCVSCSLVQLVGDVPAEEMFVDNYLYYSSFSEHLLRHAREHALGLIKSRGLGPDSLVVEIASNDGYLLRNFVEAGIGVLGIDPAPGQAEAACAAGIPTLQEFFGIELADRLVAEGKRADVIIANNVMAHVPELNSFIGGMARLLNDDGVITVENPYVRDLIEHGEFDTIYHEHVCYYSCTAVDRLVARHGLYLNDVEYFPDLHGGTLRWHIGRREDRSESVLTYLRDEEATGLTSLEYYAGFATRVESIRQDLRALLQGLRADGATIAAYGAAAKGTVMLNYAGIDGDLINVVVDRNTYKHGLHMPGVHIPIADPSELLQRQPDYTLILAWNFTEEIVAQQQEYLRRGGRFIRPVPVPEVLT
jgi:SAM-dependent methyltransferase